MARSRRITVEGKTFRVQGYEHHFLLDLRTHGLTVDQVERPAPRVRYRLGRRRRTYHPDFYVRSMNLLVEIKSEWTLRLGAGVDPVKWAYAMAAGYTVWVLVYDKDGRLVRRLM